jgi:hypothetical protein
VTPTGNVHFTFHHDLMVPGATEIPVDTATALPANVAHALGYASVTLTEGSYKLNYRKSQYGEADIAATLVGPIVPATSRWGLVALAALLIGGSTLFVMRRRARFVR